MNLINCLFAVIGLLLGGILVYLVMQIFNHYKKQRQELEQEIKDLKKQNQDLAEQLKGKQLPYFIRDELENIKANVNMNSFDLAITRKYLEEAIENIDQAEERQKRMSEIYSALRNHKKN